MILTGFVTATAVVLALMGALWLRSLMLRDVSIVDGFWGLGFVVAAWTAHIIGPENASAQRLFVNGLVTVWGIRLGAHIISRHTPGDEDLRYANWRDEVGPKFKWLSLFTVFWFQGLLIILIGAPVILNNLLDSPDRPWWPVIFGSVLWLVGLSIEAVADDQLRRFKNNRSDDSEVLDTGLWRYSRHPNYFGDALVWWGHFVCIIGLPYWGWAVASPLLMSYFLRYFSGVPMLERYLAKRKPAYAAYIQRTPAFFPWFPKAKDTNP